jgi:hypothetical protein
MLSPEQNLSSDILESVNQARLVLEMSPLRRLPRGIPVTARKCVLGRALGLEILIDDQDRTYALLLKYRTACSLARVWGVARPCGMWNGWAVLLPSGLNEFVHDFDSRCYPSMEMVQRDTRAGIQSDLRHLRFDWIDQHTWVTELLERARSAYENARHAQNIGSKNPS